MHPKRCCQQITRLLYFIAQGETFSGPDAEGVFFGVTKLFQSADGNLKRMVYLFLKAVADTTEAASLIIVTQSLVKDMFNETALYRANALRVLSSIVDTGMLGQLERYYKQRWVSTAASLARRLACSACASPTSFPPLSSSPPRSIVDKDDYVSSAALVSALLLSGRPGALDVIGRWVGEVQTVLTAAKGDMVQFHALALLRSVKRHDRLAVSKVVTQFMRSPPRSPLATILLVRYALSLLAADPTSINATALAEFLDSCA